MKYLEELLCGDCFKLGNKYFLLTQDFKKTGDKLAICLSDGSPKWIKSDEIIDHIELLTLDKDNNIIAIKERKQDVSNSSSDIS
jgi:hypothetical protein